MPDFGAVLAFLAPSLHLAIKQPFPPSEDLVFFKKTCETGLQVPILPLWEPRRQLWSWCPCSGHLGKADLLQCLVFVAGLAPAALHIQPGSPGAALPPCPRCHICVASLRPVYVLLFSIEGSASEWCFVNTELPYSVFSL